MSQKPTYDELLERIDILEQNKKKIEELLRQSQKMELIGTLAGGVAHDLNNILSGIVSYPEIILMDLPEDNPLRKPIMTIKRSGEKAAFIVNDLLTISRRVDSVFEILNLNELLSVLKTSPEFQNIKSGYSDIRTIFELEMPLHNIMGSSVNISKSILYLIDYATESIEGKGRITVSTCNKEIDAPEKGYDQVIEKGKYVTISIMDTGAGISEKDLSRIFEPFYTKKVMGRNGTGLGMPVLRETIKDHKGFIDIQSIEGRGTTFILYFPVTEEDIK